MKITIGKPLSVQMIDDCSDPRQEFEIAVGEHKVRREMSHGTHPAPWLLFPEPGKPDTFCVGMPELWLRRNQPFLGIQIEETVEDKIAFLIALNDPIEQWAAFEIFGLNKPNFTRRQLDEHDLRSALASVQRKAPFMLGKLEDATDIAAAILGMQPMDQYRTIGALGLEYKISPFTEAELRALLA